MDPLDHNLARLRRAVTRQLMTAYPTAAMPRPDQRSVASPDAAIKTSPSNPPPATAQSVSADRSEGVVRVPLFRRVLRLLGWA